VEDAPTGYRDGALGVWPLQAVRGEEGLPPRPCQVLLDNSLIESSCLELNIAIIAMVDDYYQLPLSTGGGVGR
jgi:hypothetical protein